MNKINELEFLRSCFIAFLLLFTPLCNAGSLIITNNSPTSIICQTNQNRITINTKQTYTLSPTPKNPLTKVACNKISHNHINVTSKSSDHFFLYNPQTQQTFSVLLAPYIPTYPYGDFSLMLKRIVTEFQTQYPTISLNLVISKQPQYDIYTHQNLPRLLNRQGFDAIETDMMLLPFMVENNLILPYKITTEKFWPAAVSAVTYEHKTYGVPSWMCLEFIFSHDQKIQNINSLEQLVAFLNTTSNAHFPALIGDFSGQYTWTLGPLYFNIYTANHETDKNKITNQTPEYSTIANLLTLTDQCNANNNNKCTNNYYHNLDEGELPKLFAQQKNTAYLGFTEHAFYIRLFDQRPFFAIPVPWGKKINPLAYTDAYVVNKYRCNNPKCLMAFKNFTDYMNSYPTRKWIVYSEDLPPNLPPRHLFPAIKEFYAHLSPTLNDGIYEEFMKIIPVTRAMPSFKLKNRIEFHKKICKIIKTSHPQYHCEIE